MWLWACAMQPQWIQVQNGNFERHFQETKLNQRYPEIANSIKMETAMKYAQAEWEQALDFK